MRVGNLGFPFAKIEKSENHYMFFNIFNPRNENHENHNAFVQLPTNPHFCSVKAAGRPTGFGAVVCAKKWHTLESARPRKDATIVSRILLRAGRMAIGR